MEGAVKDIGMPPYKRLFAWYKLIKLWGALRCHDAEGIPPASIWFDPSVGLQADITRSKTTGSGRKVEVVQVFISSSAYLVHRDWLKTGLEILKIMGKDAGKKGAGGSSGRSLRPGDRQRCYAVGGGHGQDRAGEPGSE